METKFVGFSSFRSPQVRTFQKFFKLSVIFRIIYLPFSFLSAGMTPAAWPSTPTSPVRRSSSSNATGRPPRTSSRSSKGVKRKSCHRPIKAVTLLFDLKYRRVSLWRCEETTTLGSRTRAGRRTARSAWRTRTHRPAPRTTGSSSFTTVGCRPTWVCFRRIFAEQMHVYNKMGFRNGFAEQIHVCNKMGFRNGFERSVWKSISQLDHISAAFLKMYRILKSQPHLWF